MMSAAAAGIGLAVPLMALARLGAAPLQLGTYAAILQGFTIVATGLFGRLSDRIGHRPLPVISGILYGLMGSAYVHVNSIGQVYALTVVCGLCIAAFWPSIEASTGEDLHGVKLLRSVGGYNISWATGVAIGPFLAGYLYGRSPALAFYVPAALAILAGTAILLRPTGNLAERSETRHPELCARRPNGKAYLYAGWVANFGAWFCVGMLRNIFPTLGKHLGLTSSQIGFVLFLWAFMLALTFFFLRLSDRWTYRLTPLVSFQVVLATGFLLVFLANGLWMLSAGVILMGLGTGMTYFSSLFYALDGHDDKGAKSGIHEVVLATGSLVGPLLGGVAAQLISIRAPYLLCTMVVLLCAIVTLALLKREERR